MLVYFHIDEVARDSVVASELNKEINLNGGRVVYGNRFSGSITKTYKCIRRSYTSILPPLFMDFSRS